MLICSDPLIAKVMVHASDRNGACKKMTRVLSEAKLQGPPTNLHFLRDVVASTCNFAIIAQKIRGSC
jgi:urea carboxylase